MMVATGETLRKVLALASFLYKTSTELGLAKTRARPLQQQADEAQAAFESLAASAQTEQRAREVRVLREKASAAWTDHVDAVGKRIVEFQGMALALLATARGDLGFESGDELAGLIDEQVKHSRQSCDRY